MGSVSKPVTAKLAKAGCKTFFVADLAEARRARARAREAAIYVLNGFSPDAAAAFVELNAQPVINSTTELAEWDAFVAAHNWRGGAAHPCRHRHEPARHFRGRSRGAGARACSTRITASRC